MKPGILAIDVGGSGIKTTVIDEKGNMLADRVRVPTPHPCPPKVLVDAVMGMVGTLPAFNRISIGFPGVIRNDRVMTAVNLGNDVWVGYPLAATLSRRLKVPARIVNDADMQGLALVKGKGIEFVFTFGTGVGTSLFLDGELMPHMELAHHPMHKGRTYEECLGEAELERIGKHRWNRRVLRALDLVGNLLRPDAIHIGGGNARLINVELPKNVIVGSNDAGLLGGARLWRDNPPRKPKTPKH